MNIQTGAYGNWQKTKNANNEWVLRPVGGGASALRMLDTKLEDADASVLDALPLNQIFAAPVDCVEANDEPTLLTAANIYVGGSGAGDNLIDGRGLVPELPFATWGAAISQTVSKNKSAYRLFIIQDDLEEASLNFSNGYGIVCIRGGNLQRNPKIVTQNGVVVGHGYAQFRSLDFEVLSNEYSILASEDAFVNVAGCSFKGVDRCVAMSTGAAGVFANTSFEIANGFSILYSVNMGSMALHGAITLNGECEIAGIAVGRSSRVSVFTTDTVFSGEVVGKKYNLNQHSFLTLNGVSQATIPGTLAGTVDTSSQVIA